MISKTNVLKFYLKVTWTTENQFTSISPESIRKQKGVLMFPGREKNEFTKMQFQTFEAFLKKIRAAIKYSVAGGFE